MIVVTGGSKRPPAIFVSRFRGAFSLVLVKLPCLADFAIEIPHCYALFMPLNVAFA